MIYVGDGLTDIPCFSLLKAHGGTCFGVFDAADQSKAKRAFLDFLKPNRFFSVHSPRHGAADDLSSFLRAAVSARATQLLLDQESANPVGN